MRALKFIGRFIHSFFADDCLNAAANISFCALLAIIPIAMMMISIAGYFLGASADAYRRILEVAATALPVGREIFEQNLQSILTQRASLGIVGVLFLVFIATILVSSIEHALDRIFKTTSSRHFLHSRLLGIALIFWVTLLFSLPTMAQILEGLLHRYGFGFPLSSLLTGLLSGKVYFFLVAFLSYLMTVVIIPNCKVYVRYAFAGGIFFALGLVVAKWLFRAYMLFAIERYDIIYGSLAAVVVMVVWIYYLSALMLLSAELVSALQQSRVFHRGASAPVTSA